jgi:hypothetical protein
MVHNLERKLIEQLPSKQIIFPTFLQNIFEAKLTNMCLFLHIEVPCSKKKKQAKIIKIIKNEILNP